MMLCCKYFPCLFILRVDDVFVRRAESSLAVSVALFVEGRGWGSPGTRLCCGVYYEILEY